MKVLELFAGERCIGKAFEKKGHEVYSIEWDKSHENIDWYMDIGQITVQDIIDRFGVPDVIWASPDCFVKGTLVNTKRGYVPIEEVKIGDEVLTHEGRYKRVYNTIQKYTNEINTLKISGCEEFKVTGNHPFYARKKIRINTHKDGKSLVYTKLTDPEWINARDLTKEYKVGIPLNIESKLPKWDGVTKKLKNQNGFYKEYKENNLSKLFDNHDFWWIMGRYLGDGSNLIRHNKYQFEICCNKNNSETEEIKEVLDRLGVFNYCFSEKATTNVFSIHVKELSYFTTQFGDGAKNKFIPDFVLDLPKDLLKSFIDGYLSADGHFDEKHNSWRITTISEKLAYSLQRCILKVYDRYCSLCTKDAYVGTIEGRTVNCKKQYILGFYLEYSNRLQYKIEDGYAWVNVKDNKVENCETTKVYTLSVEDDESYCVRNIICHNCTTFSVAAISKHRRKEPDGNLAPISEYAKFCDMVDSHVIDLIKELLEINPNLIYFIENPRGGLRKMNFMKGLPRYTTTYCQWGDDRMKPTDLWTNHPNPRFRPPCKNGDPCHTPAPRGSRTGTQGIKGSVKRSLIPEQLCDHVVDICEEVIHDNED